MANVVVLLQRRSLSRTRRNTRGTTRSSAVFPPSTSVTPTMSCATLKPMPSSNVIGYFFLLLIIVQQLGSAIQQTLSCLTYRRRVLSLILTTKGTDQTILPSALEEMGSIPTIAKRLCDERVFQCLGVFL